MIMAQKANNFHSLLFFLNPNIFQLNNGKVFFLKNYFHIYYITACYWLDPLQWHHIFRKEN